MDIRLAGITQDSIVDGPGLRLAVFVQGCAHHCPGCHNPESWALEGGSIADTDTVLEMLRKNSLQAGLTLSGGEPLLQPAACLALARGAHALGKNVWLYTGFVWEDLLAEADPERLALLREADVVVDGPFIQAERTLELRFRGSRNQRLLAVASSLAAGEPVLYEFPKW